MKILDLKYETMPLDQLQQLQLERLQSLLVRLRRNVRRYRELLGEARVETLDGLAKLPVTRPEDLASSFPYGMFALPLSEVIRFHSIVGVDGRQLVSGHTRNDLTAWGRLAARQLAGAGVTANDIIQIALGGAQTSTSAGYALGAQTIEASLIAEDPFHIDYQLAMLQNYRPTVLITTPSNAAKLASLLDQRRIDPQSLTLRSVLLSRPVSDGERQKLQSGLFAKIQCSFGVPEILHPGFCVQCEEGGYHVNEDHFLVEIQNGELLVTTLCREATPLLRYATRIAAEISREKCPCGRTFACVKPGQRLDGQRLVNEMPIYELQIRDVLAQSAVAGLPAHLDISEDRIIIDVQISEPIFDDRTRNIEAVARGVESEFLRRLGVETRVQFVSPKVVEDVEIPPEDSSENS